MEIVIVKIIKLKHEKEARILNNMYIVARARRRGEDSTLKI